MLKKTHININKISTSSNHIVKFGSCGFKTLTSKWLTKTQLLSFERLLLKKLKEISTYTKNYKLWSLVSPNKTLTKLNLESRMGKGKGTITDEIVFLKKGSIIYEFQNIKIQHLNEIFVFFEKYLPIKLSIIFKK